MISQNVYVRFETFNTRDEVLEFVHDENCLNSNINTWKEDLNKYTSYKDKHLKKYSEESNYKNIYAYHLTVLIPAELQSQKEEFVKIYMENIDMRFKRNMYIFKFVKKGKGVFAEIMAITRYVYKKSKKVAKKYKRDFYYDSQTKKLCFKTNPNAVLKIKKGSHVLDDNGEKVYEVMEVSEKEDRIFTYKKIQDLTEKLKSCVISTVNQMTTFPVITKIVSRITIEDEDSKHIKAKKRTRNRGIRKINRTIMKFIESMTLGKIADSDEVEDLNDEFVRKADNMIHKLNRKIEDVEQFLNKWWHKNILDGNFAV